ncbi:hypothetical protein BDV93DRAFT_114942 [Ceratobasidium sp. AG-I]|nr:hypothetical protein BDV93DRAFT_114942 [Ceratobasidium sp. AG-I]
MTNSLMSDRSLLDPAVAAGALIIYKIWNTRTSSRVILPPSPKSYPLISHFLSMPTESEYLAYTKMGEELGSNILYSP